MYELTPGMFKLFVIPLHFLFLKRILMIPDFVVLIFVLFREHQFFVISIDSWALFMFSHQQTTSPTYANTCILFLVNSFKRSLMKILNRIGDSVDPYTSPLFVSMSRSPYFKLNFHSISVIVDIILHVMLNCCSFLDE